MEGCATSITAAATHSCLSGSLAAFLEAVKSGCDVAAKCALTGLAGAPTKKYLQAGCTELLRGLTAFQSVTQSLTHVCSQDPVPAGAMGTLTSPKSIPSWDLIQNRHMYDDYAGLTPLPSFHFTRPSELRCGRVVAGSPAAGAGRQPGGGCHLRQAQPRHHQCLLPARGQSSPSQACCAVSALHLCSMYMIPLTVTSGRW